MHTSKILQIAILATVAAAPLRASAVGWEKRFAIADRRMLTELQTPDGRNVFGPGVDIELNTLPPRALGVLLASGDFGMTFQDIAGTLRQAAPGIAAVWFVDANRGWAASESDVWYTADRGGSWSKVGSPGFPVARLRFFDIRHGVAIGGSLESGGAAALTSDGGATWRRATLPAGALPMSGMFWLDARTGWAYGNTTRKESNEYLEWDTPDQGQVLFTTDGGETWSAGASTQDFALGTVHFAPGGLIGYLVATKLIGADQPDPHLLKTTDGGRTFVDLHPNSTDHVNWLKVGTASVGGGFTMPVLTQSLAVMMFSGPDVGRLAGSAYVANTTDSEGNTVRIYRTVEYRTSDGGATWQKTNVGTVSVSEATRDDGMVWGGTLAGLTQGWMFGASDIWGYAIEPCATDADCAPGFGCNLFKKCETMACVDGCAEGQVCVWQQCRTPAGPDAGTVDPGPTPDAGGTGPGPGPGADAGPNGGGNVDGETSDKGCGCGAQGAPALAGLIALVAWRVRRRRT